MAEKVHHDALTKVMSASINKYFDITPIGRVLSKFNSDMGAFNSHIMWIFRRLFSLASKALFLCWFLTTITYWSIIPIGSFFYLSARYGVYTQRVKTKMNKVVGAHRSPSTSILH